MTGTDTPRRDGYAFNTCSPPYHLSPADGYQIHVDFDNFSLNKFPLIFAAVIFFYLGVCHR